MNNISEPNEFLKNGDQIITALLYGVNITINNEYVTEYGYDYENIVFKQRPFCWCDNCEYCGPDRKANFVHKESGLSIWWYKHIGRDMIVEHDKPYTYAELTKIFHEVYASIEKDLSEQV